MKINEIEQHIKKVLQSNDPINPLLKACIEDDLTSKYIVNGYLVKREKEDVIISAIGKAKILLNNCVDNISFNFKRINVNQITPFKTELFNEWNLLEKVFSIAKAANDIDFNFFDKYSQYLTHTGERSVDYCGYTIPIDEEHDLFIDFVDFGLDSYQIEKTN